MVEGSSPRNASPSKGAGVDTSTGGDAPAGAASTSSGLCLGVFHPTISPFSSPPVVVTFT